MRRLAPLLLVAPSLLVLGLLVLGLLVLGPLVPWPLGRMLALSLFDAEYGFAGARFVGFDTYAALGADRFFLRAARNTVVVALAATASEVAAGLGLALLFHRPFPGRSLLTLLLVAPYVLSTMVVTGIWRASFHVEVGYLNVALGRIGLGPVPWLTDPDVALWSILLADLWQTAPFAFLILLAGLRLIPASLYEAARVDGAGPWRRIRDIVAPMMAPGLAATAVFVAILSWNEFLFALVLIQSPALLTLPAFIATRITEDETLWGELSALGVAASLPVLAAVGVLRRALLRDVAEDER